MNELINVVITNENGVNVVSSRDVAVGLGKEHKIVLRDLDKIVKSHGTDVSRQIFPSNYINSRGKTYREYLLTKDGFTLYMFNIQGHNDFKMAYINKFNEMERRLNSITEMDRLKLQLFSEDKLEVVNAHKKIVKLEKAPLLETIEEQRPMVEYHNKVLQPKGLIPIINIAKDLGMSAKKLNEILNEKGIQYKSSGCWKPYSKYEWLIPDYCDYEITRYGQTLKWTELGRKWIVTNIKKGMK